jgi:nucleoside-diphosphate-sugar epimerase
MKVLITGIAGVLGSNLADFLVKKGFYVRGLDIIRKEEAWRLEYIDEIDYRWKSSLDIDRSDIVDIDLILDCGIGVADRPLGYLSPEYTVINNILPALKLLEITKNARTIIVYPSSFNALYGYRGIYTENSPICPASIYGWTKGSVEELYRTYYRQYGNRIIITRVGSAYGPKMRSDELIAKLILHAIKNKKFILQSPDAKRLWTFSEDVLNFYSKLIDKIEDFIGQTLCCAGNRNNQIVSNLELCEIVKKVTGSLFEIELGSYETGELINGQPIDFTVDNSYTRDKLNWQPKFTLEEGIQKTYSWFKENIWRYRI